jgi:hypothetical protein
MKSPYLLFTVSASLAFAVILSLLFYIGGYVPNVVPLFLITCGALFFIISGARTLTIYSAHTSAGKSVLFLTLGGIGCFFGEFYNFLQLYSGKGITPMSLADVFYFPALFSLGIGFYFAIKANKITWTSGKKVTFATWSVILCILLLTVFSLTVGRESETIIVSIGYVIISLILSLMALRVFMVTWEYRGGAIFDAWFGIFVGICLLISTTLFLFITIEASMVNFNLTYTSLTLLALAEIASGYGIAVLGSVTKNIQGRVLNKI